MEFSSSVESARVLSSKFRMEDAPRVDLFNLFRPTLERNANKTAVIELFGDRRSLTFHELEVWSEAIACQLHGCGLRKCRNDRLAIYSPNCIEYEAVMLAAQRIGVTLVGINYMSTADELQYYLTVAEVAAIVTAESISSKAMEAAAATASVRTVFVIGSCPGATPLVDRLPRNHPTNGGDETSANYPLSLPVEIQNLSIDPVKDAALIQFSSGTTGLPKAVMLSHYNIASIHHAFEHETISNHSEYRLVYQPMSHIFGFGVMCETLSTGATLLLKSKFVLHDYIEAVEKYKLPVIHIVPPIAMMLARSDLSRYDLSNVRAVVVASAPLTAHIETKLRASVGNPDLRIAQVYGLTESTGIITYMPFNLSADHLRQVYGITSPPPSGSCGLLFTNTEAQVVDTETGKVLGPNEDGEILGRGPQIMLRYLNNKSATAATLDSDGWLHTGDIGHYDRDGYFFIVDRQKELIKYKGFQVPPAELEALILQHPNVDDVGVIGLPDELSGELPHAWIVRKAAAAAVTESDIVEWVAGRIAPYKWLRGGVRFVDTIPRSPTGKILRRLMRQQSTSKSKL